MTRPFEGRVAVVTGVTGRVGRGIARAFAAEGASVVGNGRRIERGAVFEQDLRAEGSEAMYVAGDVSQVADCERLISAALTSYGRVDILINSAGTVGENPYVSSSEVTEAWWDEIVDTNLKGAFFCSRFALAPMLVQGSGSIINISSAMGVTAVPPRMTAYVASKSALIALSKTMAVEYAARGIRINAIVLGAADGENHFKTNDARQREVLGDSFIPEPYEERRNERMSGEELAQTLIYLCRPEARHINGAVLAVDMAYTAGLVATDAVTQSGWPSSS